MRRGLAAALALAALGALVTGCAGVPAAGSARVQLVVADYRDIGYRSLLREYEREHPGVTIVERTTEYWQHHANLESQLDKGSGAADVVAIDGSFTTEFRKRGADFLSIVDTGVGGLAMCYQRDLFAEAGLPTDRADVARLWPTWQAYLQTGQVFRTAKLSAQWTDSAVQVFDAVLSQQREGFYDGASRPWVSDNPAVLTAWQLATDLVSLGESAQLAEFTPQWTAAMQSRRFATLVCPSWMAGWMRRNVPDIRGDWDVAAVPGGRGDWGSWALAVPRQTRHPREAAALAAWLTAPAQEIAAFHQTGSLPAATNLYPRQDVGGWSDPFVTGAPVGQIFTESVRDPLPKPDGPRTGQVRAAVEAALKRVDSWELSPASGWQVAVTTATAAAGAG